ncbi:putative NT-type C2 domain-containing protein [Helianthus annuus]|nr:putative NT-type C2 domain-containing protein [Helianthus annuus]
MFKSARWRSDKNKIKSVFKLQFHATQLKQVAGDTLIVSIVPADTGKPTTKLEKSKIKDGSCYWEKPHYETVKFVLDPKTGKFHEKIYNFVLATTGSSKTSSLGEVSVDFASFTEAAKICSLSLPLKNAKCAAFLHVSIQRVQESLDQREIDASENANRHERTLRAQLSNNDGEESFRINPSEDHVALTDNRDRLGSSGSDITLLASDISSAGPEEPKKTEPNHEPPAATIYEEQHMSQWDWLDGSPTELSTDDSSPGETVLEEIREDSSPEAIIKKLKTELEVLARQADVTELELQTLRKQIVKERKKGLELSREVSALKEECEKIKGTDEIKVNAKIKGDLVDELRQELNYEKDLNSNLRLQLQKTQESNAELILAVQDLDAMLEQKDSDMLKLKSKCSELENVKSETDDDDEDQKALEDIVRQHTGMQEARLLEQKINDLYGEIESYKRDKDELEMQMDQMALDYEIVKQGNHDLCYKLEQSELQEQLNTRYECTSYELETQIESLKSEVKLKSEKLSASVLAIEELESVIKNLEKDLQDQADGFEADIEDLINAKVEQEQRAIRAEESLRKMKFQNVNTAERLQEEFRRLSAQMNSSFEANEKVTTKAIDEADQLRVEKRYLEDMVKKVKQDLDSLNISYEEKLVNLSGQISQKSKELELMEKQMSSYKNEIERLKEDNKNLENVNKQKGEAYERLQSEIECYYKSRYDEMKLSLMNDETEKEKLRKQVSQLKDEIKKNENALISMEKKIKEGSKVVSKTNTRSSSKEVNNLKNKIELLEGQIKTKETALKSSENSFLEKEKDLQHKIKELERRQQALNESTSISQASTAEEMALLNKLNKSMEVELMEMQERYSEISLKFAQVEGERQQLVMTLRNLKNSKKC